MLRGLFTSGPAALFWWPTLVIAVMGAFAVTRQTRYRHNGKPASLANYLKQLPIEVACLLGYTLTLVLMSPVLLLVTIVGTTSVFLVLGLPKAGAPEHPFALEVGVAASIFVAGDFMLYWSHRLFHMIKPFWALHALHHRPEVLTPVTAFRFWPPETAVHLGAFALGEGIALGIASHFLGQEVIAARLAGVNVFLAAWYLGFSHLRHSPIPLAFPVWLSSWLVSPQMHQAHHSCDPVHQNRNFGTALAVWDRLFGTYYLPNRDERFRFGLTLD
jgi:sterol desaturase/sphingolipid hydroxylase (fatty acid hydroxylase superfamily)